MHCTLDWWKSCGLQQVDSIAYQTVGFSSVNNVAEAHWRSRVRGIQSASLTGSPGPLKPFPSDKLDEYLPPFPIEPS